MKKVMPLLTLAAVMFGLSTQAMSAVPSQLAKNSNGIVFAQEDCQEGEKWNEETQKCEKPE